MITDEQIALVRIALDKQPGNGYEIIKKVYELGYKVGYREGAGKDTRKSDRELTIDE
jgi:hypothetical protein